MNSFSIELNESIVWFPLLLDKELFLLILENG
jgi:hypothetical protein